jgi:hypothetical protein
MCQPATDECCQRFDPAPWDEQQIEWQDKRFVKDRVRACLHIPLNFGAVMTRNLTAIAAANALPETMLILSDEISLWGADVYIAVAHDVPGATMASLSGTFLTKVFEGPYRNMRAWIAEFQRFVAGRGQTIRHLYCYYPTCPKCAAKYGQNYVVLLAQV